MQKGKDALSYIEDVILDLKRSYRDPFIVVGGDFNQWAVDEALSEFPDLREVPVGPTRNDRSIDRLFSNFGRVISESGTVPTLELEPRSQGTCSDHKIVFACAKMPRQRSFDWVTNQYRYYNEDVVQAFGKWLAGKDWTNV